MAPVCLCCAMNSSHLTMLEVYRKSCFKLLISFALRKSKRVNQTKGNKHQMWKEKSNLFSHGAEVEKMLPSNMSMEQELQA